MLIGTGSLGKSCKSFFCGCQLWHSRQVKHPSTGFKALYLGP